MTQSRKFSEVLEEYVEACIEFREAEKEKMYFPKTDRYQSATEEKHRLSEELNLFFRTK